MMTLDHRPATALATPCRRNLAALLVMLIAAPAAHAGAPQGASARGAPVVVAESSRQWTGVAVSPGGRTFVNFPRWSPDVPVSVAEIDSAGNIVPYPDERWNAWQPGDPPRDRFVCVQSVYADTMDTLWILDPANPYLAGVVENGPKLLRISLAYDLIMRIFYFDSTVAPPGSYLNDVRVDNERQLAYITDSGLGALIIVDLTTGRSRRVLDDHPSTKAEDIVLRVGGRELRGPGGDPLRVHADGLALYPTGEYLYYQALTGRNLYRIATGFLADPSLGAGELGDKVEHVAESGAADGLIFDTRGNLYITAIEENAIKRLAPDGTLATIAEDPLIAWPDSFALGPEGSLTFTTSQIHLGPGPEDPYRVWKLGL